MAVAERAAGRVSGNVLSHNAVGLLISGHARPRVEHNLLHSNRSAGVLVRAPLSHLPLASSLPPLCATEREETWGGAC
jgi:hypothetical protein